MVVAVFGFDSNLCARNLEKMMARYARTLRGSKESNKSIIQDIQSCLHAVER